MSLTIRGKLNFISVAAVAALVVLMAIAWVSGERIAGAVAESDVLAGQVADINRMKQANLELVLAAMDTIIDRDEIQPERKQVIADSLKTLREASARLRLATPQADDRRMVDGIVAKVPALERGIARIDDVIDEFGAATLEDLAAYEQRLSQRFEASNAEVRSTVVSLEWRTTAAFIVAAIALSVCCSPSPAASPARSHA